MRKMLLTFISFCPTIMVFANKNISQINFSANPFFLYLKEDKSGVVEKGGGLAITVRTLTKVLKKTFFETETFFGVAKGRYKGAIYDLSTDTLRPYSSPSSYIITVPSISVLRKFPKLPDFKVGGEISGLFLVRSNDVSSIGQRYVFANAVTKFRGFKLSVGHTIFGQTIPFKDVVIDDNRGWRFSLSFTPERTFEVKGFKFQILTSLSVYYFQKSDPIEVEIKGKTYQLQEPNKTLLISAFGISF
jgi:hypothetical protein